MARLAWLFVLDEAGIKPMHFMPQNLRALGDRPARFSFSFCLFFVFFFFWFRTFLVFGPMAREVAYFKQFSLVGFGSGVDIIIINLLWGQQTGKETEGFSGEMGIFFFSSLLVITVRKRNGEQY